VFGHAMFDFGDELSTILKCKQIADRLNF